MSDASEAAMASLGAGHADRAIVAAEAAARDGDPDALHLLAQWRLIGAPLRRDLVAARSLLRAAAAAGHEQAALDEVALVANGSGGEPDWAAAAALLEQAARRHGGEAARQLALLERMQLDGAGNPLRLPEPQRLGDRPEVTHWRGLLTPEECAEVAMSVRDILEPSVVSDPATGRPIAHPVRTSSAAIVGPTRETLPIQAILRRVAAVTTTDVQQGEPLSVLHYAPGQQYRPHMDALPHEPNQRVITVIIYLNEGYAGGETHFPESGISVSGRGGDAIGFGNVLADHRPDPASRHAGLPVRQGAKWVATRWIRARRFDPWTAPRAG